MSSFLKKCFIICLMLLSTHAIAATQACPAVEAVASHSDSLDAVQSMLYDTYGIMSGTIGQLSGGFYDADTNRTWRLFTIYGVQKSGLGFNVAFINGIKNIKAVNARKSDLAEEDEDWYVCEYAHDDNRANVITFSSKQGNGTDIRKSYLIDSFIKRFRK